MSNIFKTILSDNQHGFRKTKSTLTNLMTFYTDLLHSVSNGVQVDAVYTDIKKAFDTININILIDKLIIIGVRDPILLWLNLTYLTEFNK
jgi:sarcosine oxidase/L-pipecolate oxidase